MREESHVTQCKQRHGRIYFLFERTTLEYLILFLMDYVVSAMSQPPSL